MSGRHSNQETTKIIQMLTQKIMENSMYAPEYYNDLTAEERGYKKWEQEEKNRILKMHDYKKKQEAWKNLFPVMTLSDDWLNSKDLVF